MFHFENQLRVPKWGKGSARFMQNCAFSFTDAFLTIDLNKLLGKRIFHPRVKIWCGSISINQCHGPKWRKGDGANAKSCYFFSGASVGVELIQPLETCRLLFISLVKILVYFHIDEPVFVAKMQLVENEKME